MLINKKANSIIVFGIVILGSLVSSTAAVHAGATIRSGHSQSVFTGSKIGYTQVNSETTRTGHGSSETIANETKNTHEVIGLPDNQGTKTIGVVTNTSAMSQESTQYQTVEKVYAEETSTLHGYNSNNESYSGIDYN
jgi:hypothetical protein